MELPRQWTRVKINLLSVRGKWQRPMHFVRKVGLMSTLLFDGLVDQQLLKPVNGLLSLRAMIMNPSYSKDTVKRTQQAGQLWIQLAKRYSAQNSSIKLDVPNFHIVIELLLRVLPAVRDMRLGLTTRFEAEHSQNKQLVVRVKMSCLRTTPYKCELCPTP